MPDKEVPLPKFINYVSATEDPELNYTMDLIKNGR